MTPSIIVDINTRTSEFRFYVVNSDAKGWLPSAESIPLRTLADLLKVPPAQRRHMRPEAVCDRVLRPPISSSASSSFVPSLAYERFKRGMHYTPTLGDDSTHVAERND